MQPLLLPPPLTQIEEVVLPLFCSGITAGPLERIFLSPFTKESREVGQQYVNYHFVEGIHDLFPPQQKSVQRFRNRQSKSYKGLTCVPRQVVCLGAVTRTCDVSARLYSVECERCSFRPCR